MALSLDNVLPAWAFGNPYALGGFAVLILVMAMLPVFALRQCCSKKAGPKKNKKKKSPTSGKKDTADSRAAAATPEAGAKSGGGAQEEPIAMKKQKKVKEGEDERQARKAEQARRKQQSLAAFEKKIAQIGNESSKPAGKALKERQQKEKDADREEELKAMFQKAQEKRQKAAAPELNTSGGRFAAFDGDSD